MSTPAQPERFDRYTLLHRIAEGDVSEVYVALDPDAAEPDRLVVIKRMPAALVDNPDAVKMYVDEEAMLERLHHPGIVRVRDFGKADGRFFIALEHVWGETLLTLSRLSLQMKIPYPTNAALLIGARAARALHHAHSAKDAHGEPAPIIHRDVTLNNVLLSYTGEVKILDFGIAKSKGRVTTTLTGQLKGTHEYFAPEQLQQKEVGPYTDVFQLGVLLYKLLVGRRPYPGDSSGAFVRALLSGEMTKPSEVVSGFPPLIELILMKALARDPADRFESAAQMAAALEELVPVEVHQGDAQLATVFEMLAGERHRKQVDYIEQLRRGLEADHQHGALMRRVSGEEEPGQLHVELAALPRPPEGV